jgi:cytidyltransferase-like protein
VYEEKIIPFEKAHAFFQKLKAEGRILVHCHGTFDLVHPGHIYHLEEAKNHGDTLVVTITGEHHVNKGPGRPYFNDPLRSKSLSALAFVDYVVVVPHPTAVEAIECVSAQIYCKGREYADATNDVTGNIHSDVSAVERVGGKIHYIGSVVFSSTKLLNNFFDHLPDSVKNLGRILAAKYSPDRFREIIDDFSKLRVLVIGDTIFDRYSYMRVQGLTSKNRIMSGRFLNEHTDPGGALAVVRHIQQFTSHVKMISMVGTEPWVDTTIREYLAEEDDLLVRDDRITTIIKQRFVEPVGEGKELTKLFSINYINAGPPPQEVTAKVLRSLEQAMLGVDLVVVADFGHGLMTKEVRELVQAKAPFMALNCQTNSNNHGFNIINHQYQRADCFSLDEPEMLLSCAQRGIDHAKELEKLRQRFGARSAWLTRGGTETIGLDDHENESRWPSLEPTVTDTIGAGDAFFSVAALAAAQGQPIEISTFLGQLAGGQAVKIVGNSHPISKQGLLKSGLSLINY